MCLQRSTKHKDKLAPFSFPLVFKHCYQFLEFQIIIQLSTNKIELEQKNKEKKSYVIFIKYSLPTSINFDDRSTKENGLGYIYTL